jgi:hypothetical protein
MGLALTARQFCYELTGIVVSSPNRWCHSPFMKSDGRTDAQMHTASRGVSKVKMPLVIVKSTMICGSGEKRKLHEWYNKNCQNKSIWIIKKLANVHCFKGVSKVKMPFETLKSTLTCESDMYMAYKNEHIWQWFSKYVNLSNDSFKFCPFYRIDVWDPVK